MLSLAIGLVTATILGFGFISIIESIWNLFADNTFTQIMFSFAITTIVFGAGLHKIKIGHKGLITFLGGRTKRTLPEGWVWVFPIIMGIVPVDIREKKIDSKVTEVLSRSTKEEIDKEDESGSATKIAAIPVSIDVVIQVKITDLFKYLSVEGAEDSLLSFIEREARVVVAKYYAKDLPTMKDELSNEILEVLKKPSERWGLELVALKVQDIRLPEEMENAAIRQEKERLERNAEETEINNVVNLIEIVAKVGLTPQEAVVLVQTERDKAKRIIIDGTAPPLDKIAGALVDKITGDNNNG